MTMAMDDGTKSGAKDRAGRPPYTVVGQPISLDPARLWTFEEACYYLRVGASTLRNYVRSGKLPAMRLGGEDGRLLLFKKADLDTLLIPVVPSALGRQADEAQPDEEHPEIGEGEESEE